MSFFNLKKFTMKIKKYFPILLLFILISEAQGQTYHYIIEYDYYHQTDSTDENSVYTERMLLFYNNQKSYFISKSKFQLDSVKNIYGDDLENLQKIKSFRNTIPRNNVKFEILKNLDGSSPSSYYETVFMNTYKNDYNNNFKYDLIEGDTLMAGYHCKKARLTFSGRNYTLWYTTEIPISDGPYKFSGLPGLVLKVYDDEYHHHFKINKIEKKNITFEPWHSQLTVIDASMKEIAKVRKTH